MSLSLSHLPVHKSVRRSKQKRLRNSGVQKTLHTHHQSHLHKTGGRLTAKRHISLINSSFLLMRLFQVFVLNTCKCLWDFVSALFFESLKKGNFRNS